MSELETRTLEGGAQVTFDETLYPLAAVYGAAYVFIDRCYVHLDRPADKRIAVTLRLKPGSTLVPDELAGEFGNELLGQAWRHDISQENRALIELVATRALAGSAGPPGLDELLADDGGEAFEDPLGIAMSWEEKYKKKKPEGEAAPPADASPDGEKAGGA